MKSFGLTDKGTVRKDNQGNDIRPTQVETFDWQRVRCKDDMGYAVRHLLYSLSDQCLLWL